MKAWKMPHPGNGPNDANEHNFFVMAREQLIELVKKIANADGTEKEIDQMIELLEKNVPDPRVSNYIFYDELSPEAIVDKALAYKPIQL
jgi:hypothetical protein